MGLLALTVTGALLALPAKACRLDAAGQPLTNPQGDLIGTNNAHSRIPPVPGNGTNPNLARFGNQTNAHNASPGRPM